MKFNSQTAYTKENGEQEDLVLVHVTRITRPKKSSGTIPATRDALPGAASDGRVRTNGTNMSQLAVVKTDVTARVTIRRRPHPKDPTTPASWSRRPSNSITWLDRTRTYVVELTAQPHSHRTPSNFWSNFDAPTLCVSALYPAMHASERPPSAETSVPVQ